MKRIERKTRAAGPCYVRWRQYNSWRSEGTVRAGPSDGRWRKENKMIKRNKFGGAHAMTSGGKIAAGGPKGQ